MRHDHKLLAAALLVMGTGCIDFDTAENSFCAQAEVARRTGVCGLNWDGDLPANLEGGVKVARAYGGAGSEVPTSVVTLGSNAWVAGHFDGTANFGLGPIDSAGGTDIFLGQNEAGIRFAWAHTFGGPGDDTATRVVRAGSSGGESLLMTGTFQAGVLDLGHGISLASRSGTSGFVAQFGTTNEKTLRGRALDGDPGTQVKVQGLARTGAQVAVAGSVRGGQVSLDGQRIPGGPQESLWVAGLDFATFSHLWHVGSTGCAFSVADALKVGPDGTLYLTGRAQGSGCMLGTMPVGAGDDRPSAFLAHFPTVLSGELSPSWIKVLGTSVGDNPVEVEVAFGNAVTYTAVADDGGAPVLELSSFSPAGQARWRLRLEANAPRAFGIATIAPDPKAPLESFLVTGSFNGDSLGAAGKTVPAIPGANTFFARVDAPATGPRLAWGRSFHGGDGVAARAVATDPAHPKALPVVAGAFEGQLDVELPSRYLQAPSTGSDLFVMRLFDQNPQLKN